jgi:processive 1,2-diacylglycerol beta-glucosyltransferase
VCIELCKHKSIQVAVVCGNNTMQKIKLESLGLKNLKVFGFIENIDELYKIACCMITKPGGITLTEALAIQIPLIIIKPVPGQEKENALYFERKGAAIVAYNSYEIVNSTIDLIKNPQILYAMRKNMKKMYNKSSSDKIVDDVLGSLKE